MTTRHYNDNESDNQSICMNKQRSWKLNVMLKRHSQYIELKLHDHRLVNIRFDPKKFATKRFLIELSCIGCIK